MTFVYIARVGDDVIKIGSTVDVPKRIKALAVQTRSPVVLVLSFMGGSCEERYLHDIFDEYRTERGREWFHCTPECWTLIKSLRVSKILKGAAIRLRWKVTRTHFDVPDFML